MFKNKRGAVELSITTIVIVVIGITLLALGLAWISNIFERLGATTGGAFEKADAQINEILTGSGTDNPFIVSPTSITLEQGGSGTATAVVSNFQGAGAVLSASVKRPDNAIKSGFSTTPGTSPTKVDDVVCFMGDTLTATSGSYTINDGFEVRIPIFVEVKRTARLGTYYCQFSVVGFATGEDPGARPLAVDVKR